MMAWSLVFLVIAMIAGLFGFTGIAGPATNIAWLLFIIGIILSVALSIASIHRRY